jgi:hypothetical protein
MYGTTFPDKIKASGKKSAYKVTPTTATTYSGAIPE